MKKSVFKIAAYLFVAFLSACNIPLAKNKIQTDNVPQFNADSAYNTLVRLVNFGPRVPGTPAHDSAKRFLVAKLKSYGLQVSIQNAQVYRFDSVKLNISNIIAQYNPLAKKRILLFTHWDSRFIADNDPDTAYRNKPILGANDGGSGTAVLVEIARQLSLHPLAKDLGVDFVFFDAEDQGPPEYSIKSLLRDWSLGSRYWVKHLPRTYRPIYGIGIDMVGYKKSKFAIEDYSLYYYGYLIKRIWEVARQLGYDTLFIDVRTHGIYNDHVVISQNSHIRAVMIMENTPPKYFGSYWHTHRDNLDIIDKKHLKAVGQTVLTVIYNQ